MRIRFLIITGILQGFIVCQEAFALRPFVTTDADVVEQNVVEIELGVFGLHEQKEHGPGKLTMDTPSIRFNYGLPWDSEIVFETVYELTDNEYSGSLGINEKQFADTAAFYKKVWWRGNSWMPNFATETGILFPTENDSSGIDFEGTGIFSWYLDKLTCHLTLGGGTEQRTSDDNMRGLLIYGIILDVPVPLYQKLHFVAEYSGEKAESSRLEHQLLGGVVWEGPMDIEYDLAGFTGLNSESMDLGMTMGITFILGK